MLYTGKYKVASQKQRDKLGQENFHVFVENSSLSFAVSGDLRYLNLPVAFAHELFKVLEHRFRWKSSRLNVGLKALLHWDKLHKTLSNVTYLATAKNLARQAAETVAESSIELYFLQRFTQRCNESFSHCVV